MIINTCVSQRDFTDVFKSIFACGRTFEEPRTPLGQVLAIVLERATFRGIGQIFVRASNCKMLLSHSLGTDLITQLGIREDGRSQKVFPLVLSVVHVTADDLSVTKCLPLDTLAQEEKADAAVVQGCSCSAVML